MVKKESFLDYIILLRPTLLVPVWSFLFLGYFWAKGLPYVGITWELNSDFVMIFVSYSLLMGGAYIINQITDRETDRLNKKLFLIADGIISVRNALIYMFLIELISFLLALRVGFDFLVVWFLSLALALAYSIPPVKLKGKPIVDMLANAVGYGFLNFLAGWISVRGFDAEAVLHAIPYVLSVAGVYMSTTIPDIEGDKKAGEITSGVFFGERLTAILAFFLILLALMSGFIARDYIVVVIASVSLPFIAASIFDPGGLYARLAYRVPGGLTFLYVALRFVPLLFLGILTYFGQKLYYRWRFNLDYPSLTGR